MTQSAWIIHRQNGAVERCYMDIPDLPHTGDYVAVRNEAGTVTYRVDSVLHQWNHIPLDAMRRPQRRTPVLGVEKWPTIHAVEVNDLAK